MDYLNLYTKFSTEEKIWVDFDENNLQCRDTGVQVVLVHCILEQQKTVGRIENGRKVVRTMQKRLLFCF